MKPFVSSKVTLLLHDAMVCYIKSSLITKLVFRQIYVCPLEVFFKTMRKMFQPVNVNPNYTSENQL